MKIKCALTALLLLVVCHAFAQVSYREYTDARIMALEKSSELARVVMDKRLDGMNEFREALKDQTGRYITRAEFDLVVTDVRDLRETRAELRGKASQSSVFFAYLMAGISLVISLIKLFHKP